jgi:hypothetical protein
MSCSPLPRFEKYSNEIRTHTFDMTGKSKGVNILIASVSAMDLSTGLLDNSFLASTTGSVNTQEVSYRVTGGTMGNLYRVVVAATLDTGDVVSGGAEWLVIG